MSINLRAYGISEDESHPSQPFDWWNKILKNFLENNMHDIFVTCYFWRSISCYLDTMNFQIILNLRENTCSKSRLGLIYSPLNKFEIDSNYFCKYSILNCQVLLRFDKISHRTVLLEMSELGSSSTCTCTCTRDSEGK